MQFIKESLWISWTHILKNRHDLYFDLYGTKKPLVFVLIFAHGDMLLQTQKHPVLLEIKALQGVFFWSG